MHQCPHGHRANEAKQCSHRGCTYQFKNRHKSVRHKSETTPRGKHRKKKPRQ